jgi:hypothetical protein
VLKAFDCDEADSAYEKAMAIYHTRSVFVHGERSLEDESQQNIQIAEEMSRMCLLCSAQLYPMILHAFGNPDSAKLEEVMSRIDDEGLNWLIEGAFGQR